jgi:hypothetical protein
MKTLIRILALLLFFALLALSASWAEVTENDLYTPKCPKQFGNNCTFESNCCGYFSKDEKRAFELGYFMGVLQATEYLQGWTKKKLFK